MLSVLLPSAGWAAPKVDAVNADHQLTIKVYGGGTTNVSVPFLEQLGQTSTAILHGDSARTFTLTDELIQQGALQAILNFVPDNGFEISRVLINDAYTVTEYATAGTDFTVTGEQSMTTGGINCSVNGNLVAENVDDIEIAVWFSGQRVQLASWYSAEGTGSPGIDYGTVSCPQSGSNDESANFDFEVGTGSDVTVYFHPVTGCQLDSVILVRAGVTGEDERVNVTADVVNNSYTITNVTSQTDLWAYFGPATTTYYALSVTAVGNGAVSTPWQEVTAANPLDQYQVEEGQRVELAFLPDNNYKLSELLINDVDMTNQVTTSATNGAQVITVTMTQNTVVRATFALSAQDGDTFTTQTADSLDMTFKIISVSDMTCQVGDGSHLCVSESVTAVNVPAVANGYSVIAVGDNAFLRGSSLTEINLPASVTTIGSRAFEGCQSLTTITLPESVTAIGDNAFRNCYNLATVSLSGNITSIGEGAFYNNTSLTTITLPSGLTTIANSTFYASGLTSITIPQGVRSIGTSAFYSNGSLATVEFPASLLTIGDDAFALCGALTAINLPSSLTTIGQSAFGNCEQVTELAIPASVTSIGDFGFAINALRTVTAEGTTPATIGESTFTGSTTGDGVLYVPSAARSAYQTATGWSNFSTIRSIGATLEPYAVLSENNTVLTFYYDYDKESRNGMSVGPFATWSGPGWNNVRQSITTVVFDSSFANCTSITSTAFWFYNCLSLTSITDIQNLKTDNVTDMTSMFRYSSSLTSLDVSNFNTRNVTSMFGMFGGCSGLTSLDVSNFDTSNVADMGNMFSSCSNLTSITFGNFNTQNVTNMFAMFWGSSALTSIDVSGFNTANVTEMSQMFQGCSSLTSLNVSDFNTQNVTGMRSMFQDCPVLTTLDVSGFNTANVTNMSYMFYGCPGLTNLDVSGFNTQKVTTMYGMFYNCSGLTSLNVSGFNTANVTNMSWMFMRCSGLTSLDVTNFQTTNVTSMSDMFMGCTGLTSLDLGSFNTQNVTSMRTMFQSCSNLTTIYVGSEWSTAAVTETEGRQMFAGCTNLVGGAGTTFDSNQIDYTYAHIDGGTSNPGYLTDVADKDKVDEPYAVLSDSNTVLTFYYDKHKEQNGGMGVGTFSSDIDRGWHLQRYDIKNVVIDDSFVNYTPISTAYWFYDMQELISIEGMNNINTSETTDMHDMFRDCRVLEEINTSSFQTDKVVDMSDMFYNCLEIDTLDIRSFNTSQVTDMHAMFSGDWHLTTIIVGDQWTTSAVTSSNSMFSGCTSLVGARGTTHDFDHEDSEYAIIDKAPENPGYLTGVIKEFAILLTANARGSISAEVFNGETSVSSWQVSEGAEATAWVPETGSLTLTFTPSTGNVLSQVLLDSVDVTSQVEHNVYTLTNVTSTHSINAIFVNDIPEGYAVLTDSGATLTFYYDKQKESRGGMSVGPFNADLERGWHSNTIGITTVRIDSSFVDYRPTSTAFWFEGVWSTTINGLEFLNTSEVTDMQSMFESTELRSLDLSSFNTSKVANMSRMFMNSNELSDINLSGFNTSEVTTMTYMFFGCKVQTLDLSSFNTAKVTDMSNMFINCDNLMTIFVSNGWTMGAVTNGNNMFGCPNLVGGMGTTYSSAYSDASYAHIDGGTSNPGYFTPKNGYVAEPVFAWNANELTMTSSTEGATIYYTLTDGVTSTPTPTQYTAPISVTSDVTIAAYAEKDGMFRSMTTTLDYPYTAWMGLVSAIADAQNVSSQAATNDNVTAEQRDALNSQISVAQAMYTARADSAAAITQFTTDLVTLTETIRQLVNAVNEPYAVLAGNTLTFYYDKQKESRGGLGVGPFTSISYQSWGTASGSITNVVFDESFANCTTITSTAYWFYGMQNLTTITGIEHLKTQNVTDMSGMFLQCSSLTGLDLRSFNTQNVTHMSNMFAYCSALTSLDVSSFNTEEVTQMYGLFRNCSGLTSLDLSNFNTQQVDTMTMMFRMCQDLTTIYVGNNWSTASVTEGAGMFYNCTSLVGGNGTQFDDNNVDYTYAHIDGAPANPGYLTNIADTATVAWSVIGTINGEWDVDTEMTLVEGTAKTYRATFPYMAAGTYEYKIRGNGSWAINYGLNREAGGQNISVTVPEDNTGVVITFNALTKEITDSLLLPVYTVPGSFNGWVLDGEPMVKGSDGVYVLTINNIPEGGASYRTDGAHDYKIAVNHSWDVNYGLNGVLGGENIPFKMPEGESSVTIYFNPVTKLTTTSVDTDSLATEAYAVLAGNTLTFYYDKRKTERDGMSVGPFEAAPVRPWDSNTSDITTVVFDDSFAACTTLTSTAYWFYQCSNLQTITGIENLKTANVTNMTEMFVVCSSLPSIDLSGFNTANVTNMSWMFDGCSALTNLDLNNFNTAKVTDMSYMFADCSNLTTIYVDNGWSTGVVTSGDNMFGGCTSLVGDQGTVYDANHVDVAYAHWDGGTSNPGYLSRVLQMGDANGDGEVNVADAVATVNYILGEQNGELFFVSRANMNGDAAIDIFDVSLIVNAALDGTGNNPAITRSRTDHMAAESIRLSTEADNIYMSIDQPERYTAFQFDVTLPEGTELLDAKLASTKTDHQLLFVKRGNGQFRVLGMSMSNEVLATADNQLIMLKASRPVSQGDVDMSHVLFVTPNEKTVTFIGEQLVNRLAGRDVYNLKGQKLGTGTQQLSKGVYIINGKKVVIR